MPVAQAMAPRGWVDLRPSNLQHWVKRAAAIAAEPRPKGTGSDAMVNWIGADERIVPSRLAVWIFEHEDGGYRIKR